MICQVCNESSAAFERDGGAHRLRICYTCLARSGMHLLGGWRLLPVGQPPAACPECGQSWEAFAREGRAGCPACAARFAPALKRLLERAAQAHTPSTPPPAAPADRAPEEAELSLALLLEDYELAARIRDRLDKGSARARV
jgi:protein-arginine kinase activator protein McsA